jgi:hypothetical protein
MNQRKRLFPQKWAWDKESEFSLGQPVAYEQWKDFGPGAMLSGSAMQRRDQEYREGKSQHASLTHAEWNNTRSGANPSKTVD